MKQVSRRFVVRGIQKIGIWLGQGIILGFLFVCWINNKYKGSLKYIIVCIDYRLESQKYFDFFMAGNGIILSFLIAEYYSTEYMNQITFEFTGCRLY